MTTLKPYPAYKDSGVDWLSDLPEHWDVQRAKILLVETNDRAGTDNLELLSLSKTRGILPQRSLSERLASASNFFQYRRVRPGQIVMNRMQAWNGLFGTSSIEGMISPDYAVFNINTEKTELGFLMRLVRDPLWIQQFAALSTGVGSGFNRLYSEDLGTVPFLLPPLDEQRAIADFLDGMDARVTRFLAARRKMIALLEEQKQAVINQAVTRGLDPDVPLKNSGVDWLGEIPAHWEVRRLRSVAQLLASNVDKLSVEGEMPVRLCNYTDVYYNYAITNDLAFMQATATRNEIRQFTLSGSEVLFTKDSEAFDDIGIPAVAEVGLENVVLGYHLMMARPHHCLSGHYLAWFFTPQRNRWQFEVSAKGVTRFGMPQSGFKDAVIPLPPIIEQHAITDYIDRETSRIDALINRHHCEIDLIQEYRTRLISDVVTGKWDVRGVELPAVEDVIGEEIEAAMDEVEEDIA